MVTAAERRAMTTRSRATMARNPRAVRAQTTGGTALNTRVPPKASTTRRAKVSSVLDPGPAAPGPPCGRSVMTTQLRRNTPLRCSVHLIRRHAHRAGGGNSVEELYVGPRGPMVGVTPAGPARGGEYPRAAV